MNYQEFHPCKDLLAYGELRDGNTEGLGDTSTLDFPSIVKTLLGCLKYVPEASEMHLPPDIALMDEL